jgi:hypothetical protein
MTQDGGEIPRGLRVIEISSVCAIGAINGCIANVWAGQPTIESYGVRNRALLEIARQHPGHAALIEIIEESSRPPDDAARKVAMQVFPELGTDLGAIGFVMEGGSWRIALARAVIRSMSLLIPSIQPTKIFKHPTAMLAWVAQQLKDTPEDFTSSTLEAFEYLRQRLRVERARFPL